MNNVVGKMKKDIWDIHQSPASQAQQGSSLQAGPASQHSLHQDFSQLQKQAERSPQGQQKVLQQQKQHNSLPQTQSQGQQQQQQHQQQGQQQRLRHEPQIQRLLLDQHTVTTQMMHAFPMQQTAVSKIKRSVFNLPPSMAELVQDPTTSDLNSTSSNGKDGAVFNGEKTKDNTNDSNGLRRMDGTFCCDKCKKTWRSSHVYWKTGSKQAEYGQMCKNCGTLSQPKSVKKRSCFSCWKVNSPSSQKIAPAGS